MKKILDKLVSLAALGFLLVLVFQPQASVIHEAGNTNKRVIGI